MGKEVFLRKEKMGEEKSEKWKTIDRTIVISIFYFVLFVVLFYTATVYFDMKDLNKSPYILERQRRGRGRSIPESYTKKSLYKSS